MALKAEYLLSKVAAFLVKVFEVVVSFVVLLQLDPSCPQNTIWMGFILILKPNQISNFSGKYLL